MPDDLEYRYRAGDQAAAEEKLVRLREELARATQEPAAVPSTPATQTQLPQEQAEAEAKRQAILADKNHPYHKGNPAACAEFLELCRQALGAEGQRVVTTADGRGTPADSMPVNSQQPITTPETALGVADEIGFDRQEMGKLMSLEAGYQAGRFNEESALDGLDPVQRDRLRTWHKAGMERLPLSLQIHLEHRGTAFAPGIFSRIAELGQEMEQLDEMIAVEGARDPMGAKLKELVRRRHGQRGVTIAF